MFHVEHGSGAGPDCESAASPGPEFSTELPHLALKFVPRKAFAEPIEKEGFRELSSRCLRELSTTGTGSPQVEFRTTLPLPLT
jgi:hypothetical protein